MSRSRPSPPGPEPVRSRAVPEATPTRARPAPVVRVRTGAGCIRWGAAPTSTGCLTLPVGATRSLGSFPVPRPRGVLSSRAPRVALPMADGVTAGKDEARLATAEPPAGQDPRRGFMRGRRCRPRAFPSSSASEGSARCCPSAPS